MKQFSELRKVFSGRVTPVAWPNRHRQFTALLTLSLALLLCAGTVAVADPVVSNVRAAQRAGTQFVDITYDLVDSKNPALTVSVAVSTNGGLSYFNAGANLSGAVGVGVVPGSIKQVIWNAAMVLPAKLFSNVRVSVTANDSSLPTAPPGMVLIPAGNFIMGDSFNESDSGALPTHAVQLSAFNMDKYEVSMALWDKVYSWAIANGYSFDSPGSGKAANHPVHTVSWYDMVKWCNGRSEKEGRTPAYYTSEAQTSVYRTGRLDVQNDWVKWNVGFRLPTEAEWEYAERGGASGHRFPWSDAETITHSRANYYSNASFLYDISPTRGLHPDFNDGVLPYTSPVGSFAPNGYGLYDMAGNVYELCWDWYGSYPNAAQTDPRGPASGPSRVNRGGSWSNEAVFCQAAGRYSNFPSDRLASLGFRSVLPSDQ